MSGPASIKQKRADNFMNKKRVSKFDTFLTEVSSDLIAAIKNPDVIPSGKGATSPATSEPAPATDPVVSAVPNPGALAPETPTAVDAVSHAPAMAVPQHALLQSVQENLSRPQVTEVQVTQPVAPVAPAAQVVAPSIPPQAPDLGVQAESSPHIPETDLNIDQPEAGAPSHEDPAMRFSELEVEEDDVSITSPARRRGRPRAPEPMEEKSFNIEKSTMRKIRALANIEGYRLDRSIGTSEVIRHLLLFALQHVKEDIVFSRPNGTGLHIK